METKQNKKWEISTTSNSTIKITAIDQNKQ